MRSAGNVILHILLVFLILIVFTFEYLGVTFHNIGALIGGLVLAALWATIIVIIARSPPRGELVNHLDM
jgi:hypothetical protein